MLSLSEDTLEHAMSTAIEGSKGIIDGGLPGKATVAPASLHTGYMGGRQGPFRL